MSDIIYLSHILNDLTPSYGNRGAFQLEKQKSMDCGDHLNESDLHMSTHTGTHIDMPRHFYKNGQTIEDFPASFWYFEHPLIIEIQIINEIIFQEIVETLKNFSRDVKNTCDLLMVKTGMGEKRDLPEFWKNNPGFSPDLYAFFKTELPSLRVLGFDSISLTGFQNRELGKIAHRQFLNPKAPILILEDMKLDNIFSENRFKKIIISPLRVAGGDGLPCTVFGFFN